MVIGVTRCPRDDTTHLQMVYQHRLVSLFSAAKGGAEEKPGASALRSPTDLRKLASLTTGASRQVSKKLWREVNDHRNDRDTRPFHLLEQGDKRMTEMRGHLNVLVSEVTRDVSSNKDDRR